MDYHSEFRRSIDKPEEFWREKAGSIDWIKPPATIWQATDNGHGQWFPDGTLNTSDIALDANVALLPTNSLYELKTHTQKR